MGATLQSAGEVDSTVTHGEQRVVTATTDVVAGVDVRTALPHDYRASSHFLASETLHAEALGA
jgi:hypothetical protein